MKSIICKWLFVACFSWCTFSVMADNTPVVWQPLAKGLEYTRLGNFAAFPGGYIHAFRVDLAHYQLRVLPLAAGESNTTFNQLMQQQQAVLAVNGSFFAANATGLKPLGLRMNQGVMTSPLRNTSWWSVFTVQGQHANIVAHDHFKADKPVDFAIQAGPRLLVDNQIVPQLKPGTDLRTALCIQKSGKVIVLATQDVLFSTEDLAQLLQLSETQGGLACEQALNLDGGHSTQLYAHIGDFSLSVPSSSQVADAVLVVPH